MQCRRHHAVRWRDGYRYWRWRWRCMRFPRMHSNATFPFQYTKNKWRWLVSLLKATAIAIAGNSNSNNDELKKILPIKRYGCVWAPLPLHLPSTETHLPRTRSLLVPQWRRNRLLWSPHVTRNFGATRENSSPLRSEIPTAYDFELSLVVKSIALEDLIKEEVDEEGRSKYKFILVSNTKEDDPVVWQDIPEFILLAAKYGRSG